MSRVALGLATLLAAALTPLSADASGAMPAAESRGSAVEQEVARSLAQLVALRATREGPRADYDRDYFGTAWADVDGNDCRTRDDVLARDLRQVEKRDACTVVSGVLSDPYTGRRLVFSKSRASAIQIDHVLALSLAWRSGASRWSPGKRATFANDPLNLLAVDGPTNQRKSDHGPAGWMPPDPAYRCTYVIRFVRVAFLYGLTVSSVDRAAAKRTLRSCRVVKGPVAMLRALSPSLWPHAAQYVHVYP